MFLKCRKRRKDGKEYRSWSIVESRRYAGNKVAHRHVLYLGEINDSQPNAWERTIAVIDERDGAERQLALFPADRTPPPGEVDTLQVRLSELTLEHPRQWGACWLGDQLWRALHLDDFFGARLPVSREDTDWKKCCASSWFTGCSRRAANGGWTRIGLARPRWPICSAWTSARCRTTRSIAATIWSCH